MSFPSMTIERVWMYNFSDGTCVGNKSAGEVRNQMHAVEGAVWRCYKAPSVANFKCSTLLWWHDWCVMNPETPDLFASTLFELIRWSRHWKQTNLILRTIWLYMKTVIMRIYFFFHSESCCKILICNYKIHSVDIEYWISRDAPI